ncbi:F-box domain-containing protein [Coniochaeta sp. 2T2.1]|nr:F-box domain-containing protein [Coniochaeta sp. 2T2.1]
MDGESSPFYSSNPNTSATGVHVESDVHALQPSVPEQENTTSDRSEIVICQEPDNAGDTASKGKERATDNEPWTPTGPCHLSSLPPELIDYIFSFLPPVNLATVSATCRDLYQIAITDHLWQPLVQANVPGTVLASPSPCPSFRHLYAAHDLRWFLPKHKLWFCDRDLTGKLILARYDPRTGNIEGYQLLAISNRTVSHHWQMDDDVIIHSFEPRLKLHIDRPIVRFEPTGYERIGKQEHGGVNVTRIPVVNGVAMDPQEQSSASDHLTTRSSGSAETNRFRAEIPLAREEGPRLTPGDIMHSNFMLARALSPESVAQRKTWTFPYGNVWPPPVIPADHRVAGASDGLTPFSDADFPSSRAEVADQAFRIRTWLEMRSRRYGDVGGAATSRAEVNNVVELLHVLEQLESVTHLARGGSPSTRLRIGEEVSTFCTLDQALYTPTERYPYRGIWVGDYSGHGCEFLLVHQPERPDDDDYEHIERREGESDGDYAQRKRDSMVYRGRLEAIKLTGDPNVPRGEYTFIVDDMGPEGFVRTIHEEPFNGARVVKSKGHVAGTGFVDDKYMESQLILTSHDRLAQYWLGFGHISFFERVNIDDFLSV